MPVHFRYVVHGTFNNPYMDIVNVFYVSFESSFTPSPSQASSYLSELYGPILPDMPPYWGIDRLGISQWMGPADGIWWDNSVPPGKAKKAAPWGVEQGIELAAINGTGEGDTLPPQVAALVYAKTAVKHVIARKFLGPIVEASQDSGHLGGDEFQHFVAFSLNWSQAFVGAGGPPGTKEVWGPRWGFNPLTSYVASPILATNRRRKIGRGS